MTIEQFQTQMNRLVSQFGKAAYSVERSKIIWNSVKELSQEWWERAVDQLLGNCRQAPLMPEIGEMVARERERVWNSKKKQREVSFDVPTPRCSYCRDSGDILARLTEDKSPWSFKCSCEAGRQNRNRFPLWETAQQELYEVVR